MSNCNHLSADELLTRATSLLDLGDTLTEAIERNYAESARLRDQLMSDSPCIDPRPAMRAHCRLDTLVEHAQHLLQAQAQELDVLAVELATRSPGQRRDEPAPKTPPE
ncbi:MAG: hypothetical protein H6741_18960 [Alphaproteobacteria bacterium]|nr:hypothetical protein [Alphaproteobacteria bacterium]